MAAKSMDMLGSKLAYMIKKDQLSSCGVLRLAGKECYPGKTFETLSLNELKTVLENGLPKKLQNLRVKNINEVVREMLAFLKRNEVEIRGY